MNKIKNIEFLRIFLILGMILMHFCSAKNGLGTVYPEIGQFAYLKKCFYYGNNCADGFFIISGFLLLLTFKPVETLKHFVVKKYIRLTPVIIFSSILAFILAHFGIVKFNFINELLAVLLLNNFPICWAETANNILWFTSVLFGCSLIYWIIIKYCPPKISKFLIFIIFILGYWLLLHLKHGSFGKPLANYYDIFNIGFLRGIGGIGLGIFIGYQYKDNIEIIKNKLNSKISKLIITLIETYSLGYLIYWMLFYHPKTNCKYFVINFAVILTLFIINKGWISQFFNKDIWVFLGKYQYSVYVIHVLVYKAYLYLFLANHYEFLNSYPIISLLSCTVISITASIAVYYLIEKPSANFLQNKILKNM